MIHDLTVLVVIDAITIVAIAIDTVTAIDKIVVVK